MGKRKRSITDVPTFNGMISSNCVDNVAEQVEDTVASSSSDDYDVWLVRKPVRVPLSHLSSIKFPHKAKDRTRLVRPSDPCAVPLNCHFNRLAMPHVFIPTGNINSMKDAMKLKAACSLKGVVLVTEKFDMFDGNPAPVSDEVDVAQDPVAARHMENDLPVMNFTIASIRKKPPMPTEDIKQRLKPFGIISKKRKNKQKDKNLIS